MEIFQLASPNVSFNVPKMRKSNGSKSALCGGCWRT